MPAAVKPAPGPVKQLPIGIPPAIIKPKPPTNPPVKLPPISNPKPIPGGGGAGGAGGPKPTPSGPSKAPLPAPPKFEPPQKPNQPVGGQPVKPPIDGKPIKPPVTGKPVNPPIGGKLPPIKGTPVNPQPKPGDPSKATPTPQKPGLRAPVVTPPKPAPSGSGFLGGLAKAVGQQVTNAAKDYAGGLANEAKNQVIGVASEYAQQLRSQADQKIKDLISKGTGAVNQATKQALGSLSQAAGLGAITTKVPGFPGGGNPDTARAVPTAPAVPESKPPPQMGSLLSFKLNVEAPLRIRHMDGDEVAWSTYFGQTATVSDTDGSNIRDITLLVLREAIDPSSDPANPTITGFAPSGKLTCVSPRAIVDYDVHVANYGVEDDELVHGTINERIKFGVDSKGEVYLVLSTPEQKPFLQGCIVATADMLKLEEQLQKEQGVLTPAKKGAYTEAIVKARGSPLQEYLENGQTAAAMTKAESDAYLLAERTHIQNVTNDKTTKESFLDVLRIGG